MEAFNILQTNCAICHQGTVLASLYQGGFNFILDLAKLTSSTSPSSSPAMPLKYIVNGKPGDSYIYKRIVGNSMPPSSRTQRPTATDADVLSQWIASCIDDSTSPEGWPGPNARPDAGVVDAGPVLENCSAATVCPNNGCCVFGTCRPNGTTCGQLPNPIPGQMKLLGLAGTCMSGSCEKADGGSCGKVGEPCCDNDTCTATQASCLTTDMSMCSACGGTGQPCCRTTVCLGGHQCVGDGVGRVGMCLVCGGLGQPCCGSGVAALQTCNDALTCVSDPIQETRCTGDADGGSSTGGDR